MSKVTLFLLSFVFLSCDFTPGGEVMTQVPDPDLSDVKITINYSNDTIPNFQDRQIHYSVTGNEVQDATTTVALGGTIIQEIQSTSGDFTIDVSALGTGVFPLTIYSVYTTRTKSLEDHIVQELYYIAQNWVVVVDIDPPTPVQITSIETVLGQPVLHWEKYTRVNFQNYLVVKKCYNSSSHSYQTCQYQVIQDQNTTSYTDNLYVSGAVEYYIEVTASYQTADGTPVQYP